MNALRVKTPRWTPAQSNAKREPAGTCCLLLYTANTPCPVLISHSNMVANKDSRIVRGACIVYFQVRIVEHG